MPTIRQAQIRRTRLLKTDPVFFHRQLWHDLHKLQHAAEKQGLQALCRLNVGSDEDWLDVVNQHPGIMFYDYTKVAERMFVDWPANYHLTFSRSELTKWNTLKAVIDRGRNIAVVIDVLYNPQHHKIGPIPERYRISKTCNPDTVDGDKHDWRLPQFDGHGKVILLRLKGTNRAKQHARDTGFAVKPNFAV